MSGATGSYASLGILDFGRVFEPRWWTQRHHTDYALAYRVRFLFLVFHCALDQGYYIGATGGAFVGRSDHESSPALDNTFRFLSLLRVLS